MYVFVALKNTNWGLGERYDENVHFNVDLRV